MPVASASQIAYLLDAFAEEIALAQAAQDGPGDDTKERPTCAVCPCRTCLIAPHLADSWDAAMAFWLAAGAPMPPGGRR